MDRKFNNPIQFDLWPEAEESTTGFIFPYGSDYVMCGGFAYKFDTGLYTVWLCDITARFKKD